jgi:hypothetical protein
MTEYSIQLELHWYLTYGICADHEPISKPATQLFILSPARMHP